MSVVIQGITKVSLEEVVEEITTAVTSINSDHALIHKGFGFNFSIYETLTTEQVRTYSFKAPTTGYAHIKNLVLQSLGGSVKMEILKDVAVTVDTGAVVSIVNANDNSTLTPTVTIKEEPTFTGGTVALGAYALSDSTNQSTGNASFALNTDEEFVSKSDDAYYVIKFTNLTTTNVPFTFRAFFYEEYLGLVE